LGAPVAKDVCLGILLDKRFKVGEGLRLKPDPNYEARRQIERIAVYVDGIFELDRFHKPKKDSQKNILLAFHKAGISFKFDEFLQKIMIVGLTGHGPIFDDPASIVLRLKIEREYGVKASVEYFNDFCLKEAYEHRVHPVRDRMATLQTTWDGTPRIETWLIDHLGSPDTPYFRAIGRIWLIAGVRRVRDPGCKFDQLLVLEGGQGVGKSSTLRALAMEADWFSDYFPLTDDPKRVIEAVTGKFVIEMAELSGMRKTDVEPLKALISRQVDEARMAYGRQTKRHPRQCVLAGTTNNTKYLRDVTGARRFWPVPVGVIDLEAFRLIVTQLWAEAAHLEAMGEPITLDEALYPAATEIQEDRRVEHPFFDELDKWLVDLEGKILAADVWTILAKPGGQRTQTDNEQLGEAMRKLGFARDSMRFGGKNPQNGYWRGNRKDRINVHLDEHNRLSSVGVGPEHM
jgi:Virulence-associated protein E